MLRFVALLLASFATSVTYADEHVKDAPPAMIHAVMILHSANAIDHGLQRGAKSDRLPHRQGTDPLSEVSSIEVSEREIVLRAQDGDIAFAIDSAKRTTSITKGYSVPQIAIEMSRRETLEGVPVLAHGR